MAVSNDTRGWIMTAISGVACVLGASIICADVLVCKFPGMRGFRIQNSNSFLSASLSLSFGVMLFSSLFKMLPSAKRSLVAGSLSKKEASWVLIICFIGGALGIQILSRVMHHYIPSHVVSCEHSHEEADTHGEEHARSESRRGRARKESDCTATGFPTRLQDIEAQTNNEDRIHSGPDSTERPSSKPSLPRRVTQTLSKLSLAANEGECNDDTPCRGFTETCGQECFKTISSAPPTLKSKKSSHKGSLNGLYADRQTETTPLLGNIRESVVSSDSPSTLPQTDGHNRASVAMHGMKHNHGNDSGAHQTPHSHSEGEGEHHTISDEHSSQHHHHVPNNAFLSIGLQTSIAIALHKLPEGFITYATNHANPQLGFSVFLALFIHNITEGFALALPLYLAIQSRWRAMLWAFLLGGCSQPLGAAIAALWFHIAGNTAMAPGERVYGAMFAITAGIMTSVALQLFSESLDLTHNRNLCMISAFAGMGIMGISSALTA